ncbi:MAG: hypothetical protein JWM56_589 [Candidatus Peribacteria bacterium]|nr:hypothetical protein [Candidatus Peribacteria bacterium]
MDILNFLGVFESLSVLFIPLMLTHLLVLVFIPSILTPGSKPAAIGKAIYSYLMQTFGIILMSASAIPALRSVLSGAVQPLGAKYYLALLIVFATGGLVFLLHEHMARTIDETSKAVPYAIYFYTLKIIGFLATVLAALALLSLMLLGVANTMPDWWIMPVIALAYGLILSWCTQVQTPGPATAARTPTPAPTQTMPVKAAAPMASTAAKAPEKKIMVSSPAMLPSVLNTVKVAPKPASFPSTPVSMSVPPAEVKVESAEPAAKPAHTHKAAKKAPKKKK